MSKVYLLLGSNLGDRKFFLEKAITLIDSEVGSISKVSSIYESEPWGFSSKKLFLNQVVIVNTDYQPLKTLRILQKIEKKLGRELNSQSYQNRTIDIDILFYDDIRMKSKALIIPHPRLHLRAFAMIPLIEIAKDYLHPAFGKSLESLSSIYSDNSWVKVTEYAKSPIVSS